MTIEEAKKLIPQSFRVFCNTITVEVKDKGDKFGEYNSVTNVITLYVRVYDDLLYQEVSKEMFMHTFYHELGHCFSYFYNTDMNEEMAQAFANFVSEYQETKTLN